MGNFTMLGFGSKGSYTVKQLYENPPGAGSGNVVARYRIRESLNSSFIKLVKEHKWHVRILIDEKENKRYYIVDVPSEALKKDFFFTVAIEVDNSVKSYLSFMNSTVRIASNNPAFTFTGYAYISDDLGFFIPQLKKQFDKKAFTKPKTRNPQEIIGFDKSLWFAVTYLIKYDMFDINVFKGEVYTEKLLLSYFTELDRKLAIYNAQKTIQLKKEKRKRS